MDLTLSAKLDILINNSLVNITNSDDPHKIDIVELDALSRNISRIYLYLNSDTDNIFEFYELNRYFRELLISRWKLFNTK